ncbi:hypothetical protein FTUN_5632 [Frigoriglobus tundricola]|uniref:Methyltransferase FkbM domain-containing protein n=1 Tax=Frigoriglobus tundricola TaxID=2774151 RepID=A0A6M5YYS0_9BACT|nr:hypothetical protein FTUN_5632 [Frigoriglobus tundricola]
MGRFWTLQFFRAWHARLTLGSVLRYRSFLVREGAQQLRPTGLLRLAIKSPIKETIWLREVGSDLSTFDEILIKQVYRSAVGALRDCRYVVDLGANIGLASLYFAHAFPNSRVLAVEPDPRNYALLARNTHRLGRANRVVTKQAAIWSRDAPVNLVNHHADHDYNRLEVTATDRPDSRRHLGIADRGRRVPPHRPAESGRGRRRGRTLPHRRSLDRSRERNMYRVSRRQPRDDGLRPVDGGARVPNRLHRLPHHARAPGSTGSLIAPFVPRAHRP